MNTMADGALAALMKFHGIAGTEQYELSLLQQIGKGSYGIVHRGLLVNDQGNGTLPKDLAVKCFCKSEQSLFRNELAILKTLRHNHLISLIGQASTCESTFLVFEMCHGGTLQDQLVDHCKRGICEDQVKIISRQMASALSYLHNRGIVHRDIKAHNVMLQRPCRLQPSDRALFAIDRGDLANIETKLIDFGMSIEVKQNQTPLNGICGTIYCMAPEVLQGRLYTRQCDIYSLGMMILHLLTNENPFPQWIKTQGNLIEFYNSNSNKMQCLLSPMVKKLLSKPCLDFLKSALNFDPLFRLSASQMANHTWLVHPMWDDKDKVGLTAHEILSKSIVFKFMHRQ